MEFFKNVCDLTALFMNCRSAVKVFKTFFLVKSVDKLQNCAMNSVNLIQANSEFQVFV